MARIIAIDYGMKRVGLAVTDPLKIICSPLTTVLVCELLDYLKNYIQKENIEAFVLGMPVNLDGSDTDITAAVRNFHLKLVQTFPQIPVHLVDERFTSKMASHAMITGGINKKDRRKKGTTDMMSASIILQFFLEQQLYK